MPRRYGPDGVRLWNGKRPEDFTELDTLLFIAETETILNGKEHVSMSKEKTVAPQEAVQDNTPALPLKMDVSVRPIEPMGNLLGFASVTFNDSFAVHDFKVLQSDKGMFVGMPSKPDKTSKTGYRDTSWPTTKEFRAELTGAVVAAYHTEVEKLQARAAAITSPEKQSIKEQIANGAEKAAKDNAARPAPAKGKAKNAER